MRRCDACGSVQAASISCPDCGFGPDVEPLDRAEQLAELTAIAGRITTKHARGLAERLDMHLVREGLMLVKLR